MAKKGRSPWNKGKIFSEKVRKEMSIAQKGKHHSEKTKRKISNTLKEYPSSGMKGKHHSKEIREKISKKLSREGNPNWQGGMSFLPYPSIFDSELKQFIRKRDNNECQNPFCNYLSKKLTVHHIDFNKDNCSQFNLITLCVSCNSKANNKYRWQRLYKKIVWSKYV